MRTWLPVTSADAKAPPSGAADHPNRVFRIGLLGHGTVGSAFADLLPRQAARIERLTGLRPELSGVMTRSSGSFEEILESSDLIVEVVRGRAPERPSAL